MLPKKTHRQIDKIQRDFLWGSTFSSKKNSLYKMGYCYPPKHKGGLRIRKSSHKNQSLLASLAWRLSMQPSFVWARVLINSYSNHTKAKYCWFIWCNILTGCNLYFKCIAWSIGNGTCIEFWNSIWLPNNQSLYSMLTGPLSLQDAHLKVSEVWKITHGDLSQMSFELPQIVSNLIQSMDLILNNNSIDTPFRVLTSDGSFSTKSTISFSIPIAM